MPFREETINESGFVGIGVDITERCNRDCPTCFAAKTGRDMNIGVYQRIIEQGNKLNFPEFYILGGEPGMRKDILEILQYGVEKFKLVFLVTNLDFLANQNICEEVAKTGVIVAAQRHTLSTDTNAQRIERIMTGGNHLDTSHAGWKNVEKYFPPDRVCVQCCITKPVVESGSIFEVFRWARQKGYEVVMEFTKEGRVFKRGCEFDISRSEMMKTLKQFQEIDTREFGLSGASLLSPQAYGKNCHMQETSIHFRVNGEAIPCVGFPGISYGNIMQIGLEEIMNHPLRQFIKNPLKWIYGYCREECPYFEQCTGGCRGSAFDITGCYRASFYYCPHIPNRLNVADMIPPNCTGCPLEGNPSCHPRRTS
ncbi:MAG: radical SAM protein [bacterium]|nr:radical SAM protein [bacterium]